ncbi:MAG: GAP family protein [Cyanobacteriota bacterium]
MSGSLALWSELSAYGLGVGFSPLHIGLILLLLLGEHPLRRASLFVLGWFVTTALMVLLMLGVGHSLLLTMQQGSDHRTGLDLLAAGALLALGLKEVVAQNDDDNVPAWARPLDRFAALPLPLLIAVSAGIELVSPDDLFLFAKAASALLAAQLSRTGEVIDLAVFGSVASLWLSLPLLALLIGRERILPLLQSGKALLYLQGDRVVEALSLALAVYLAWQGISGLRLN